jgi:hypothetical protein
MSHPAKSESVGSQSSFPTLSRIERELSLICLAPPAQDVEIDSGFASDILSEVLARASQGSLLVTSQSGLNVIAVASFAGIPGVIVTSGHEPAAEVVGKAREEGVGLYATSADTFDVVGTLARLGVAGRRPERGASRAGEAS